MPASPCARRAGRPWGGKRDLFEGGIRSPLIAWWPGTVAAGTESGHICAAWDFFPTFCEMAGVAIPGGLDGISILPTLTAKGKQPKHEPLYWEFHTKTWVQAVRMGKWKGIRFNAGADADADADADVEADADADAPIRLFNLEEDIGEMKNVAAKHPEVAVRIAAIMKAEHTPSEVFPFVREK